MFSATFDINISDFANPSSIKGTEIYHDYGMASTFTTFIYNKCNICK